MTGRDHIPGTYLLHFAANFLKSKKFNPWPHIMAGDIQLLPAFVEIDKKRGLPIPLMFEKKKDSETEDGNILEIRRRGEQTAGEKNRQYKALRSGYISVSPDNKDISYLEKIEKVFRTHNTIRDDVQRPTRDIGGVYSYEGIAPNQVLHSQLRIKDQSAERGRLVWQKGFPYRKS